MENLNNNNNLNNNTNNNGINDNLHIGNDTASTRKEDNKPYFIYNIDQANYLMLHEAKAIGIGFGGKGDLYIKFPKNEKTKEVLERWKNLNQ